jgi:26S proteasome regulatory subunit T1
MYHSDIQVLKTYGAAPYSAKLKELEKDLKKLQQKVNEKIGTKSLIEYDEGGHG